MSKGLEMGRVVTYPVPSGWFPMLQSGGQKQNWPTTSHIGYTCCLWVPQHLRAGDKSKRGPQMG